MRPERNAEALGHARGQCRSRQRIAPVHEEVTAPRERLRHAQHLPPARGQLGSRAFERQCLIGPGARERRGDTRCIRRTDCGGWTGHLRCAGRYGRSARPDRPLRHHPVLEQRPGIEYLRLPLLTAALALQLAAGCFGHAAGVEQRNDARCLSNLRSDHTGDLPGQHLGRDAALHTTRDLGSDAHPLLSFDIDGKGGHTALANGIDLVLDELLDILRVQVVAPHDDHVLQAPGHEKLTVPDEAEIAGAQPAQTLVVLDECLGGGGGALPVTRGDAGAAGPDLADDIRCRSLQGLRVDDANHVPDGGLAAADQSHSPRLGTHFAPCERRRRERAGLHALASLPPGHHQRAFGEPIAGVDGSLRKTVATELLDERLHRVGTDGFGAGIGDTPAAQVETFALRLPDAIDAQPIGKIGTATDRHPVTVNQAQPAHRARGEMLGRAQHARDAAVQGLEQPADQPHVMKQR